MNTNFTIKNFRVFDKNGVTIPLSPLSFLVGCNSSGKSSIVKSLLLLKTQLSHNYNNSNKVVGSIIDFSAKPISTLGSFDNTIHKGSRNNSISYSYTLHSGYIDEDVIVSVVINKGELGNGYVNEVCIALKNGTVIVSAKEQGGYTGDLIPLKYAFKKYLVATELRKEGIKIWGSIPEDYLSEETEKQLDKVFDSHFQKAKLYCDENYLNDICNDIFPAKIKNCKINATARKGIDGFVENDILTYMPIMEEMKTLKNVNEIYDFFTSKLKDVKGMSLKEELSDEIDIVCGDFSASGKNNFIDYYRDLEDLFFTSFTGHEFLDDILKYNVLFMKWQTKQSALFKTAYDLISNISDNEFHTYEDPKTDIIHPLYKDVFKEYVNKFFVEVLSEDITSHLEYVSSSRIDVRRLYPLEDKNEFSELVKRYFEAKTLFMTLNPPIRVSVMGDSEDDIKEIQEYDFMPGDFMNKWLRIFKVGDHISLEIDKNGLGLLIKVYKDAKDKKGVLLADLGYGITQLFSILIQIEEMIMHSLYSRFVSKVITKKELESGMINKVSGHYNKKPLSPWSVAIEEPEIHLHPKYQSLLANMFLEAYKTYNIQFIIETHSEYLLRKIQTFVGAKKINPDDVSLIYVENDEEVSKGAEKVRCIPIKKDGRLGAPFGSGFYDEADNLSFELFEMMGN